MPAGSEPSTEGVDQADNDNEDKHSHDGADYNEKDTPPTDSLSRRLRIGIPRIPIFRRKWHFRSWDRTWLLYHRLLEIFGRPIAAQLGQKLDSYSVPQFGHFMI